MRSLRLVALCFRLGALDALQYRADFFVQLVQSVIRLATALAGLAIIFSLTDDLAGWRPDELLALVGVWVLVGGLVVVVIRPSFEHMMSGIRHGTLDFTLTKPVDAQLLVSVRRVEIWRLVDVGLGAGIVLLASVRLGAVLGLAQTAGFLMMLAAGVAIIYSFLLTLSTLAFWLVRLENILVLFGSMYEAGRWPVGIYPPWLRATLTFLVPVAFAITIPVEARVGRLEWPMFLATLGLAAGFLGVSRWFWRRGLQHYSGASS